MSAKANHFKLGLFVLAGTGLLIALVVVLGAGELFRRQIYLETYFDESVNGLSVGSPVNYRGVKIGSVDAIDLCSNVYRRELVDDTDRKFSRYVYVRISFTPINSELQGDYVDEEIALLCAQLIQQGLRVRLASQGITGMMYLETDFLDADSQALEPPLGVPWKPRYQYLPMTRSTVTRLTESLVSILSDLNKVDFAGLGGSVNDLLVAVRRAVDEIDIGKLSADVRAVLVRVEKLLGSEATEATFRDAAELLREMRGLVETSGPEVQVLVGKLSRVADRLETLSAEAESLLGKEALAAAIDELPASSAQLKLALTRANDLLARNQGEIRAILENIRRITESVHRITESAEKYPAQVLFGAPPPPAPRSTP